VSSAFATGRFDSLELQHTLTLLSLFVRPC
jgi:hypothetical protein